MVLTPAICHKSLTIDIVRPDITELLLKINPIVVSNYNVENMIVYDCESLTKN